MFLLLPVQICLRVRISHVVPSSLCAFLWQLCDSHKLICVSGWPCPSVSFILECFLSISVWLVFVFGFPWSSCWRLYDFPLSIQVSKQLFSLAPCPVSLNKLITERWTPSRRKPRFVAISSAVRPCWFTTAAGAKASRSLRSSSSNQKA